MSFRYELLEEGRRLRAVEQIRGGGLYQDKSLCSNGGERRRSPARGILLWTFWRQVYPFHRGEIGNTLSAPQFGQLSLQTFLTLVSTGDAFASDDRSRNSRSVANQLPTTFLTLRGQISTSLHPRRLRVHRFPTAV
jgi:hypothetical protein